MDRKENNNDYSTIDISRILKAVLEKIWFVIIAGVVAAVIGFILSSYVMEPKYSATVRLYVDNATSDSNLALSTSQIDVAKKLVDTYKEILHSEPTYESIIEQANLPYKTSQLKTMISSGAVDGTAIMYVTVTSGDADEAAHIANAIVEVFPKRIEEYVKGTPLKIVEPAKPNYNPTSPSVEKYTVIGMVLGVFLSVCIICLMTVFDNRVYDENYIIQSYGYPMLAKLPKLHANSHSRNDEGYVKTDDA